MASILVETQIRQARCPVPPAFSSSHSVRLLKAPKSEARPSNVSRPPIPTGYSTRLLRHDQLLQRLARHRSGDVHAHAPHLAFDRSQFEFGPKLPLAVDTQPLCFLQAHVVFVTFAVARISGSYAAARLWRTLAWFCLCRARFFASSRSEHSLSRAGARCAMAAAARAGGLRDLPYGYRRSGERESASAPRGRRGVHRQSIEERKERACALSAGRLPSSTRKGIVDSPTANRSTSGSLSNPVVIDPRLRALHFRPHTLVPLHALHAFDLSPR